MAVVCSKVLLIEQPLIYTSPDTCIFGAVIQYVIIIFFFFFLSRAVILPPAIAAQPFVVVCLFRVVEFI